jgi:hypothetical protein
MTDFITDATGVDRRLGLLMPTARVSALPAFEASIPLLNEAAILTIAKTNAARGRDRFDESYIKNQQSHGSCNGFAGGAAGTKARVRRGLPRRDLSGAYLYSLINGGQDMGSMLEDGMRKLVEVGCATDATVGWDQIFPHQYDRAKADAEAANNRMGEAYAVGTLQGLWTALALGFDCVVAVHVGSGFMRLGGDAIPGADAGPGNHAVSADGIGYSTKTGELMADGVNSWGLDYGDRGRMQLTERHFRQTFANHVFYAVRTTVDGDVPGPPKP